MLIVDISYLYSHGILLDLHHPLQHHLIVVSHSTFILTYAKSLLIYVLLPIGRLDTSLIPLHSDWMIHYLLTSWTLTYLVS